MKPRLTNNDWINVYRWVDAHPYATQADTVKHFATRPEGALIFDQGSLSRNLKKRDQREAEIAANPAALSSKRARVVVRADCLATNTEYCDRCTHAATQATNVARIKTEGTKGLLQGQVAG
jgi:hypothetical protein